MDQMITRITEYINAHLPKKLTRKRPEYDNQTYYTKGHTDAMELLRQKEFPGRNVIMLYYQWSRTYQLVERLAKTDESSLDATITEDITAEVHIYPKIEGTPLVIRLTAVGNENTNILLPPLADTVEQYIGIALEEAATFRIPEKNYQTIREFVRFKYQSMQPELVADYPEMKHTYYNLLLYGEDMGRITEFVHRLTALFARDDSEIFECSEKRFLDGFKFDDTDEGYRNLQRRYRIIYIYDCQQRPYVNEDAGTGSQKEESVKAAEKYSQFWNGVAEFTKKYSLVTFIVSMSESTYKTSFSQDSELNYRIFPHRIYVPEVTMEQVLDRCYEEFRRSSVPLSPDFLDEFTKYVRTIYQRAELKGISFALDAVNRVYALYFSRGTAGELLTPKYIPKYRAGVRTAEDVLERLNNMVGLQTVKETFATIYKKQLVDLKNAKKGPYHMMFYGNPGTGKTTVARLTADLLWHCGILKSNKYVEATVGDIVSSYRNNTAAKIRGKIQQALNGVLFIDEAYGLASGTEGATEALNILIQEMLNYQDCLVVILAGYEEKMEELLKKNEGLASRIAYKIRFEDFSVDELKQIFLQGCGRIGFTLDASAEDALEECLTARKLQDFYGNGRDVEKLLQEVQGNWSKEFYELIQKDGREKAELPKVFYQRHFQDVMPAKNEPTIENMVGLENVKKQLEKFNTQVKYLHAIKEMGMKKLPESYMHMLFMGNPGTGKTTIAKMIANDLYSLGVLKTNRLVVAERKDIISTYSGGTAQQVNKLIKKAIGGVLFIDEAYSLAEAGEAGKEAVETIMTAMVEHKEDTIFIFAGYPVEMSKFLELNPGIPSRLGYTFVFEDYNTDELIQIFKKQMDEAGFVVSEDAIPKIRDIMDYFSEMPRFGNGRFVEQIISRIIANRSAREYTTEDYNHIEVCDVPDIADLIETNAAGQRLHDPQKISEEGRYRTAYHELGHAIAVYELNSAIEIEKISVKSRAFSLGRVSFKNSIRNRTEDDLRNEIVILLAGRCAERVFCGNCDEGCLADYERAKGIADAMLNRYGMCDIGITSPADLLRQGDKEATRIIQKYQKCIEEITGELMEGREFTGEEFKDAVEKRMKKA